MQTKKAPKKKRKKVERRTLRQAVAEGRKVVMFERQKAAWHVDASLTNPLKVDAENGVILGAAVCSVGEAKGHGVRLDQRTLEMVKALADPDGVVMHLMHPQIKDGQLEDQLTTIVGRCKNLRIEGAVLRGDCYLFEAATNLPGRGDVRGYLLRLAQEDPASFGLSLVLEFDTEVATVEGKPERLIARPTAVYAVDFVHIPAANARGLLAAADAPASPPAPAPAADPVNAVTGGIARFMAAARVVIASLRTIRDTWSSRAEAEDGLVLLHGAILSATPQVQAAIVAARALVDTMNPIRSGSIAHENLNRNLTTTSGAATIFNDEAASALELLYGLRWGRDPLSDAADALTNYLATACATIGDMQARLFGLNSGVTGLSIKPANTRMAAVTSACTTPLIRNLAARAILTSNSEDREERIAALHAHSSFAAAAVALVLPSRPKPEATGPTPPTENELRFGTDGGPKMLTYLRELGITVRHLGHTRLTLVGTPAALRSLPAETRDLFREWYWLLCEAVDAAQAAKFSTLARQAETPEERERLGIIAMSHDYQCPQARALFEGGTTISIREAEDRARSSAMKFANQDEVPEGHVEELLI